jgi:hypothetical protein
MGVKKDINWEMIELYMKAGCSQINIAKSLYIDRDTLRDRVKDRYGKDYSAVSAAFCSEGEMLIEAQQLQKAMKGYWPALLWLGKIRCGQKEPENMQMIPPHEDSLALRHENMILKSQIEKLLNKENE